MNAASLRDLRPLTIGELLDRTFRLFRRHFFTFFSIIAITQLPAAMLQILATAFVGSSNNLETSILSGDFAVVSILVFFGVLFLSGVVTQVGTAALITAISDSYLGRKVNFDSAFRRMDNTWLTLILASIVAGLILVGVAIPIGLLAIIPCLGGPAAFVGFISIGAAAIVLFSLLPPVVVLERAKATDSIRRAWVLSKLRFWWIFGYLLLLGILTWLITFGPSLLIGFLIPLVIGNTHVLIQSIIQQSASLVLTAIFMPIHFTAVTLMYFDLRIRFEGFDLMVLAFADNEFTTDESDLTSQTTL